MQILIAGLGSIGRRHLQNLRRLGVSDIILYRRNSEPLEEAPELPVFTDLGNALEQRPDVVIVSNPTATHLDIALPAAQKGCNLFIEKPLSHSWEGVEKLLATIEDKRLVALMGFNLRFDPGLCKVKALLEEERIGRLVAVQAQVGQYLPDWHPREDYRKGVSALVGSGGGVLLDLIHEFDYLSWLLGSVSQVSCIADKISSLEIETEDTAAILLRFENGAIGSLHLDYIQRAPSRTCRIVGERGTILWDYFEKRVQWYQTNDHEWREFAYAGCNRNDAFLAEMQHLMACVQGYERPRVDAVTGSKVLKLALAAKHSAMSGKVCPVNL